MYTEHSEWSQYINIYIYAQISRMIRRRYLPDETCAKLDDLRPSACQCREAVSLPVCSVQFPNKAIVRTGSLIIKYSAKQIISFAFVLHVHVQVYLLPIYFCKMAHTIICGCFAFMLLWLRHADSHFLRVAIFGCAYLRIFVLRKFIRSIFEISLDSVRSITSLQCPHIRLYIRCLCVIARKSNLKLWPLKMDIGAPVTPAVGNVHINFVLSFFVFKLGAGMWQGNRQTDRRTNRQERNGTDQDVPVVVIYLRKKVSTMWHVGHDFAADCEVSETIETHAELSAARSQWTTPSNPVSHVLRDQMTSPETARDDDDGAPVKLLPTIKPSPTSGHYHGDRILSAFTRP